jgi:hypothetical protein
MGIAIGLTLAGQAFIYDKVEVEWKYEWMDCGSSKSK